MRRFTKIDGTQVARGVRELFQRAVMLIRCTHLTDAEGCLDELLDLDARHPDALAMRGWIHMIHHRQVQARADLEAALRHAPPGWPRRAEVVLQLELAGDRPVAFGAPALAHST